MPPSLSIATPLATVLVAGVGAQVPLRNIQLEDDVSHQTKLCSHQSGTSAHYLGAYITALTYVLHLLFQETAASENTDALNEDLGFENGGTLQRFAGLWTSQPHPWYGSPGFRKESRQVNIWRRQTRTKQTV